MKCCVMSCDSSVLWCGCIVLLCFCHLGYQGEKGKMMVYGLGKSGERKGADVLGLEMRSGVGKAVI